jgi:phosphatidate cytidylyltransferase
MMWKRILTAAVLMPLAVGLVLWGSTPMVAVAVGLLTLLSLFEYFALGDAIGHRAYRFWTAACALLLIYVQWRMGDVPAYKLSGGLILYQTPEWFVRGMVSIEAVFFLFVLGIAVLSLWTKRPLVEALPAAGISASGLVLVAFPLSFAVRLHGSGPQGPLLLLFTMVIIWASDTSAYFAGRSMGRHSLAPHLSPKKTWEGSIASFVCSLIVALVFVRWIAAPLPQLLGLAAVANVAGQVGDLLESAYKRSAGIKDSGSLLPGHGGVLDRIDALILAIPVVWYYWIWFHSPS